MQLFRGNYLENIRTLKTQVKKGELSFGEYSYFTIRDPKERNICAAAFPERVLHHAMMNVCERYFEKNFIYDTYACRKEKGMHKAVARARYFSNKNVWCLKIDIKKYYDSIDHVVLLGLLARLFKDKMLLKTFTDLVQSYSTFPGKGIPIGNLTSQYFANYYLGFLDRYIKEELKIKGYVRYMDDMLLWGQNKKELQMCLSRIREFLKETLLLEIKESVQLKPVNQGVSFLGYRIFPFKVLLAKRSRKRFIKKMKGYENHYRNGDWTEEDLAAHVQALQSFTLIADAAGFRRKVIREIESKGGKVQGLNHFDRGCYP